MAELDPQALAEFVATQMVARDAATRGLGITVSDVAPGRAVATMRVRADMLNGFQTCHGGFITALADSAFAFACNSTNELTVASGLSIDFMAPGQLDDVLTAQAQEVAASGRTGVYDVQVTNQHGKTVAVFRGRSHRFKDRPSVPV